MKKTLLTSAAALLTCAASQAALINIDSYTINSSLNNGTYVDTGGTELTDGDALTDVWPQSIGADDYAPLVSWFGTTPDITLNFAATETIGSFTIWMADSDGSAGVYLPTQITLSTTGGFNQTFAVTNPAGNGTTVPITISGLNITTDNLNVQLTPAAAGIHTMVSEVSVSAVPEPSSTALLGLGGLALLLRRKK